MFLKNMPVLQVEWMAIGGNGLMHVLQDMAKWKSIHLLKDMPGRLTETVLLGNLLLRSFNIREKITM